MRRIGLAALFLLASMFGALAADTGTQGTGKRAQPMHHKTMHHRSSRHYGKTAYYRHGRYRTAYYVGGRRHYRNYALYGTPGHYYYFSHGRRVFVTHGPRRVAVHRTPRGRTATLFTRRHPAAMHRGKGQRTAMIHRNKGAQNQTGAKTQKATKAKKPSTY